MASAATSVTSTPSASPTQIGRKTTMRHGAGGAGATECTGDMAKAVAARQPVRLSDIRMAGTPPEVDVRALLADYETQIQELFVDAIHVTLETGTIAASGGDLETGPTAQLPRLRLKPSGACETAKAYCRDLQADPAKATQFAADLVAQTALFLGTILSSTALAYAAKDGKCDLEMDGKALGYSVLGTYAGAKSIAGLSFFSKASKQDPVFRQLAAAHQSLRDAANRAEIELGTLDIDTPSCKTVAGVTACGVGGLGATALIVGNTLWAGIPLAATSALVGYALVKDHILFRQEMIRLTRDTISRQIDVLEQLQPDLDLSYQRGLVASATTAADKVKVD